MRSEYELQEGLKDPKKLRVTWRDWELRDLCWLLLIFSQMKLQIYLDWWSFFQSMKHQILFLGMKRQRRPNIWISVWILINSDLCFEWLRSQLLSNEKRNEYRKRMVDVPDWSWEVTWKILWRRLEALKETYCIHFW